MESPDHGDEHELMLQILYRSPKCDPVGFPVVGLDFFLWKFSALYDVVILSTAVLTWTNQNTDFGDVTLAVVPSRLWTIEVNSKNEIEFIGQARAKIRDT